MDRDVVTEFTLERELHERRRVGTRFALYLEHSMLVLESSKDRNKKNIKTDRFTTAGFVFIAMNLC